MPGSEPHSATSLGWLRAAVLGADDGIVTTASIALGVAASSASHGSVVTAASAALIAGALSMAAGEFVSVSSQRDAELAMRTQETAELRDDPDGELEELTGIYVARGVEAATARQVAQQLMSSGALEAHLRDELGITDAQAARPLQASLASALSFVAGAAIPLVAILLAPQSIRDLTVAVLSLGSLALLGALGARAGGAPMWKATLRVVVGGGLAMAVTVGVGRLLGAAGL